MKEPTVTQAYAMIRLLKKRAAAGDADKIRDLSELIAREKDRAAQLDLDRFFSTDPQPLAGPKRTK